MIVRQYLHRINIFRNWATIMQPSMAIDRAQGVQFRESIRKLVPDIVDYLAEVDLHSLYIEFLVQFRR